MDKLLRDIRKMSSKPWGGVQVIFTGDFYQLPPMQMQDDKDEGKEYAFEHETLWNSLFDVQVNPSSLSLGATVF